MDPKKTLPIIVVIGALLVGCQTSPAVLEEPILADTDLIPEGMSADQVATLSSLEQVDDYPLYTMTYTADYSDLGAGSGFLPGFQNQADWACSLFAVYGDPDDMLFGRNFDWDFSPGLLLYTDPEDGYASVSMVDIHYLGFGHDDAYGLTDLPLEDLERLLSSPYLPFDGLNEAGLAVGMAAVPDGNMAPDPEKETIDSLLVIRKILDEAATVEEAVQIIRSYNIDWEGGPPLHYLVADDSGRSALIEFSRGKIIVLENQEDWQMATNFLVSEALADSATQYWRYGMISERLDESGGRINSGEAMTLLEDVSQNNTQWSVVYRITPGEVRIAMGRDYSRIHQFDFWPAK